jgi:MFS family permease
MSTTIARPATSLPWWRQLAPYHWFVLCVASAAWLFDCLDQRLSSLARIPALTSLMQGAAPGEIQAAGKEVTAIFLVGWGVGGLIFGALGDRYGRAKMLTATILLYSLCTGLTFFSQTWLDFALFRLLTGMGVGGVFGLAAALVAETVPDGARAGALGTLQALSAIGNISAGFIKMLIDGLEHAGTIRAGTGWRWMFLVGILPALLVILIQRKLQEPEPWLKLKREGRLPSKHWFTPYVELLKERRWRRNLAVGAVLASTGVIGLWAIGEYAVDIQRNVFHQHYAEELVAQGKLAATDVLTPEARRLTKPGVDSAIAWGFMLNMVGAVIGMALFTRLASAVGRRIAFAIGFLTAMIVTLLVYWKMQSPADAYWMMPLMGAAQLSVFAGYAIYLPELFPSRLRSTGTSFCYNLGRFAAAIGSLFSAALATQIYGRFGSPLMERYSAMTMCAIFLLGLLVLPWAPETKGRPLPEEESPASTK